MINRAEDRKDIAQNIYLKALIQLTNKMPTNDVVKANYLKVAKTIRAEIDYERVVKAVQ